MTITGASAALPVLPVKEFRALLPELARERRSWLRGRPIPPPPLVHAQKMVTQTYTSVVAITATGKAVAAAEQETGKRCQHVIIFCSEVTFASLRMHISWALHKPCGRACRLPCLLCPGTTCGLDDTMPPY